MRDNCLCNKVIMLTIVYTRSLKSVIRLARVHLHLKRFKESNGKRTVKVTVLRLVKSYTGAIWAAVHCTCLLITRSQTV